MNLTRTLDRQLPLWIKTIKTFVDNGYPVDSGDRLVDQEGEIVYLDYLFYVANEIGLPPMDLEDIVKQHDDADYITQVILNRIRDFGQ